MWQSDFFPHQVILCIPRDRTEGRPEMPFSESFVLNLFGAALPSVPALQLCFIHIHGTLKVFSLCLRSSVSVCKQPKPQLNQIYSLNTRTTQLPLTELKQTFHSAYLYIASPF